MDIFVYPSYLVYKIDFETSLLIVRCLTSTNLYCSVRSRVLITFETPSCQNFFSLPSSRRLGSTQSTANVGKFVFATLWTWQYHISCSFHFGCQWLLYSQMYEFVSISFSSMYSICSAKWIHFSCKDFSFVTFRNSSCFFVC